MFNIIPDNPSELHLTGNMERYTWSFDGIKFGKSTPVHFRSGERLRVIFHNDTMMGAIRRHLSMEPHMPGIIR